MQWVEKHQFNIWAGFNMSSMYRTLSKMEEKGLVSGTQEIEGNNPPRKVYKIKKEEKKYLKSIVKETLFSDYNSHKEWWIAVSFIRKLITKSEFLKAIKKRISELEKIYDNHDNIERKYLINGKKFDLPYYINILIDMGGEIYKTKLESLKRLEKETLSKKNNDYFIGGEDVEKTSS